MSEHAVAGPPDPPDAKHMRSVAVVDVRGRRSEERLSRWVLAAVVTVMFGVVVRAAGLAVDLPAHLSFARELSSTGQTALPYYLFQQATVVVRALIPFGMLGHLHGDWAEPDATWNIAGIVTMTIFLVVLAELIYARLLTVTSSLRQRDRYLVCGSLTLTAMLVAPISILTWNDQQMYFGYVSTNVFHNPTSIVAKPFALLLLWVIADRIFATAKSSPRTLAAVALLSVMSLHAKPNFTLCLLPAVGLMALWGQRRRETVNWWLVVGGFGLPSVAYLGYQYLGFSDVEGGVALAPFRMVREFADRHDTSTWLLLPMLGMSLVFPLVMLALFRREIGRSPSSILAWLTTAVGIGMFYLLAETGPRAHDGNFAWSAQISLFVLFFECIRLLFTEYGTVARAARAASGSEDRHVSTVAWVRFALTERRVQIATAALALHLLCGIWFYAQEIILPTAWW